MQSHKSSFIEACLNAFIGYWISFVAQLIIYPAYGGHFSLVTNIYIGLWFAALSIIRGYMIRRWFNQSIHKAALKIAGEKE
jgi:phosphate starvation-inducible membrane PsiE